MSEIEEAVENKKGAKSKKKAKPKEGCDSEMQNNVEMEAPAVPQVKAKAKRKPKNQNQSVEQNSETEIKTPKKKRRSKLAGQGQLTNTGSSSESPTGKSPPKKRKPRAKKIQQQALQIKEEMIDTVDEPLNDDIKYDILGISDTWLSQNTPSDSNNIDDDKKDHQTRVAAEDEKIEWPQNDLSELIKRIEVALPEKDSLAYSTRAEKLIWDDIAFNEYTGAECKKIWFLIQKRVRRFRLLSEVLQDAKEWISKPWTNFYRGNKTKRHPDMPRRPLSVYMLFYLKKKDSILSENPGMEMTEVSKKIAQMYKGIPPPKREKYMQLAADERKIYEEKLEEFYRLHPEIPRYVEKPSHTKTVETGPKKPSTPFGLYYEDQLKNFYSDSEVDRNTFKEQCKEQWKNMSDKKKVVWIDWALDKEAKYQDELKNYISQNPNFAPAVVKPVLTKEEKSLKERLAGKPIKPPNSAYSLFSRMMLQSDEIKKIPPKDRMKAIADQWKSCTDKEKKQYRERASHMMEQYKLDFASYLESLPEEKRQEELQNNLPKRKTKGTNEDGEPVPKKKKKKRATPENGELALLKIFESQPAHPPVSGFVLFSKRYHGKLPVETAWKNLSKLEKREYETEVHKLKQKYIKEYEKFLKSLTKEQLTAFSQYKRKREEQAASNDNDDKSEGSSSCDSGSESESSDGEVEQE